MSVKWVSIKLNVYITHEKAEVYRIKTTLSKMIAIKFEFDSFSFWNFLFSYSTVKYFQFCFFHKLLLPMLFDSNAWADGRLRKILNTYTAGHKRLINSQIYIFISDITNWVEASNASNDILAIEDPSSPFYSNFLFF